MNTANKYPVAHRPPDLAWEIYIYIYIWLQAAIKILDYIILARLFSILADISGNKYSMLVISIVKLIRDTDDKRTCRCVTLSLLFPLYFRMRIFIYHAIFAKNLFFLYVCCLFLAIRKTKIMMEDKLHGQYNAQFILFSLLFHWVFSNQDVYLPSFRQKYMYKSMLFISMADISAWQ